MEQGGKARGAWAHTLDSDSPYRLWASYWVKPVQGMRRGQTSLNNMTATS